ncbi:GPP34 family phosphoprotein [Streptomyces sp. QTS137]
MPSAGTRLGGAVPRPACRSLWMAGESPDARTAAVTALLSSNGALRTLRPALTWSAEVRERAKTLVEKGIWGAQAVSTAVARTAAAVAASSTAVTLAVVAS